MTLLNGSSIALLISNIIGCLALIHNISLTCYHIYRLKGFTKNISSLQWLSITYLLLSVLMNIVFIMSSLDLYPSSMPCKWQKIIGLLTFTLIKIYLYLVLCERLFVVFKNSAYTFNPITIYMTRICIICDIIFWFTLMIIYGDGYIENNKCHLMIASWILIFGALLDLIITVLILITFSRKLLLVHFNVNIVDKLATQNGANANQNNVSLLSIIRKSTILGIIALNSSIIVAMIFSYIFGLSLLWGSIDTIINCWCIVLMFEFHSSIYNICCTQISKHVSDQCLSCCSCHCCCHVFDENKKSHNNSSADQVVAV